MPLRKLYIYEIIATLQSTTGLLLAGVALCSELLNLEDTAAHLVTTGMGPVYDGIGHLFLTPEDLIPAIALGLYTGLRGKTAGRRALFFFPLAWLLGGVTGLMITSIGHIAADFRLSDTIVAVIVVTVGTMHGLYNGITLHGGGGVFGLFGISSVLFILLAIVFALVISLQSAWTRVAVRVAGSWIAAAWRDYLKCAVVPAFLSRYWDR